MKNLLIILSFLLPITLSAQLIRSYGVIEIGATFPTSTVTGAKFAYRTVDSSYYRWSHGNVWVKIVEPSIITGLTMPFDSVTFKSKLTDPVARELKYSTDHETLMFGAGGTVMEIGQKEAWYVKNQTLSTIPKGTVVMAAGALGASGRILVSPMVSNGTVSAKYLLGIAATDIASGADGYVIDFGKLYKMNTNSWNEGDVLYCSPTIPGALTNVEPAPPNLRLPIAFVINKHAVNGVLAIRIQTGNELHELHDVDTSGINTGEGLVYNSTLNKWQASAGKLITAVDTAAMLSKYIERGDTAAMLTNYVDGAGTATRIPILTGARTIGNSPALYNSTTKRWTWDSPSILELPMGTDAQRPSPATTSDFWYNMTSGGLEWYNGTRWAKALESTANRFTSGSLIFADANGQATQDNANIFINSSLFNLRLGPTGAADRAELGAANGSGSPYLRLFDAGAFDAILSVSNSRFSMNTGLTVNGAMTTTSNFVAFGLGSVGTGQTNTGLALGGELILRPNNGNPGFINFTETGAAFLANMGVDNTNGDFKYETLPSGEKNWETGTTRFVIKQNGRVGIGSSTTVNYSLEQTGQTDAFGIARGTVAQRPTIVTSTTPIRYNTDSTALEYGESVGTWRQLATRAYARSLTSALPTTNIYTADGTLTGNRTLTGSSFWLNLNSNVGIKQAIPLQELDVNGDLRVRDSIDLDVTPAHSAITGLLTRDATGWVGAASVGTGLAYSAGVLSSSGWNLSGNSISGSNFLGSTNNQDVVFKQNNIERFRLNQYGGLFTRTVTGAFADTNEPLLKLSHSGTGEYMYSGITLNHAKTTTSGNQGGSFLNFSRRDSARALIQYDYIGPTGGGLKGALMIRTEKDEDIVFQTNSTSNKMIILGNGNVGIGTIAPTQELDVNGELRVRDSTILDVAPAHTTITGLLTRDVSGRVGAATLGGGLSYSGGVLSSSVSTGTVTSVGLSLPSIFSVSGSPITTSGTLSASFTGGNTRQVLRGDGIWANTLDSFRINQSLASVEIFEVNGNIVLNRGSGSNKLILTRNWNQEISAGGSNGNMTYRNGSGAGFQNYFLMGSAAGFDTTITMHATGLGVSVGKSNKVQARLHVKGAGTTTGKTMLVEDSGGNDILTVTDNKTIQAHGYGTQTKEAGDITKTFGNVAAFATDGTMLDYRITRDTTVDDVDFTVTSTLLSSCQELVITAQLLGKGSDLTITLPTPSATYKGNKVGIFVIDVALQKIVISGSMYYTTDPTSVTPTVQTSLDTDSFYKGSKGAYYDFVCARNVNGTYYWKLKQ